MVIEVDLVGIDIESLLVDFLSELTYIRESQNLAFDEFDLDLNGLNLQSRLHGTHIESISKEIKAVTYHNLIIKEIEGIFHVNIVFDV